MTSAEILQVINLIVRYVTPYNCLKKPLLTLKQRIIKKGMVGPVLLLSEFCFISELLDKIRFYFPIMKDLFYHPKISTAGCAREIEGGQTAGTSNCTV